MKLFELKHLQGPFGDECSTYNVIFQRETTVRELINYVINQRTSEWGYIEIGHWPAVSSRMEYRWGTIVSDNIPESTKDSLILNADAYGGWSRMDYNLEV